MSIKVIKVPNIGEFKDVEVIEVLIKKGQEINSRDGAGRNWSKATKLLLDGK